MPVCLNVWADAENGSDYEKEAAALCKTLAGRFEQIDWQLLPRRVNYPYYPVIGVMGGTPADPTDYNLRIIGLPNGMQMTTLVAAIQAAAFPGQTIEPLTRIKLHRAEVAPEMGVNVELLTIAEDEAGPVVAKALFGFATSAPWLKAFVVMADQFPESAIRYSVENVPHLVLNRYIHYRGPLDEDGLLKQVGLALKREL